MDTEAEEQAGAIGDDPPPLPTSQPTKQAPAKEDVRELCRDMFDKVANYVNGELTGMPSLALLKAAVVRARAKNPVPIIYATF